MVNLKGANMHMTKGANMHTTKEECEGSNASLMKYKIELSLAFQNSLRIQAWELAASLIVSADPKTLNDFMNKSMEFIWFLRSQHELDETVDLIRKIVSCGACDFTMAIVKSSFLASCLSVYGSLTTSLEGYLDAMVQRLHRRNQNSSRDEMFKAGARSRIENLPKWAMRSIDMHSKLFAKQGNGNRITVNEVRLQLQGFRAFMEIAGGNLSRRDFVEAFEAACFPLTHVQSFGPRWESGISAYLIQSLLGLLMEGGANNLNRCLLDATQFGSTELVRIFLQLARQKNSLVYVNLALRYASHLGKIRTMECLVEEGRAAGFLKPLCGAAKQGRLPVVQWFVAHGCQNAHLIFALAVAASNNRVEIAAYLLRQIPLHFLSSKSSEIIKITYRHGGGGESLRGVSLLLQLNFLGDASATYAAADAVARSDDEATDHELKDFLREEWSEEAFLEGMRAGEDHYMNLMRVLRRGESGIWLRELPAPLLMAIACLPLYRECLAAGGRLLPQRVRGRLVEASGRLSNGAVDRGNRIGELMAVLERHLSPFVRNEQRFAVS